MQHTISALVENRPGVLARISGLFARRGFNIESLAVNITDDPSISRMTIVVRVDDAEREEQLEQITKQLNKLVDVIKVNDFTNETVVERELALIKVAAEPNIRAQVMQIVDVFRAKIVDMGERTFVLEVTGSVEKIDAIEKLLEPFGIKELVRTGKIVLVRGLKPA